VSGDTVADGRPGDRLAGPVKPCGCSPDGPCGEHADRTPEPSVSIRWGVAFGGEDPNECAGLLEYDDQAEAEEMTQWIDGGYVARQKVVRWPWERADGKEIPPEPEEPRPGDQPPPVPNDGPSMHDLVIADGEDHG
jgi:hypothetical protein